MPDSFLDDIAATMSLMEDPVAVHDPESGTSTVVDRSSGESVDNIDSENLDEYLEYARYGSNIQHGVLRHKRDFFCKGWYVIFDTLEAIMGLIFDGGKVSSSDFMDYLKGIKDFASVLKTAADEEVAQNSSISDILTAKASRRADIRARFIGDSPIKTVAAHSVIALKKKEEDGWVIYDHTGKKKLGGPYGSEKEADERIRQIEYFKENKASVEKAPEAVEPSFEAIASSDIYNLSRYAMEFSAWASIKSRQCDSYARSINAAFSALASKSNASLFNIRAVSNVVTTPSFPKRALKNLRSGLLIVLAKNINPESKRLIEGMLSDIRLAERHIPEVKNVK